MSKDYLYKSVAILGYGREGQSTHRFLLRSYPEAQIGIFDRSVSSLIPESNGREKIYYGEKYLENLGLYETIIVSPGISLIDPAVAAAIKIDQKVTTATNIFFEQFPGKTIGVTGTKGKSTTSSLIFHLLKNSKSLVESDIRFGGNIGYPVLDQLSETTTDSIFVLELSSYQLSTLNFSPNIAVLLNIVPEHLDYHGSFQEYVTAKARITLHQSKQDTLIYNPSFEIPSKIAATTKANKVHFSHKDAAVLPCFYDQGKFYLVERQQRSVILGDSLSPLLGEGNRQNILAAIAVATLCGVKPEEITLAFRSFTPLEHRLENVGTFAGVTFINDSLSTIPEALSNALSAFPGEVETVIAGGYDRGLDYAEVGKSLLNSPVKNLILFPTTGEKIWAALESAGQHEIKRLDVNCMREAVLAAFKLTSPGKVCLLSPASSSFNIFKDYRDRGESFKREVKLRAGQHSTDAHNICNQ